ncbi:growth hormone releasing hormone receptor, like isoform X5 [Dunckerocampus dactyliophorus]|uniref:growth hormone releasing hormone receptor, like isoform X5 n=1 Tax=Dunckerocampus dactyliophorus TaxID=161453 RepID=UPI0024064120|nr:growth hormone releasing hormone receptor, like isoform X5 [Dunckerocampus dactyliophorus]
MDLPLLILREGERGERERGAQYPELLPSMGSTRHKLAPRRVDANMLRMQSRGAFLALCLAPAALTSLLHPECEFIFQLEKDERRCLRSIAGEANTSAQGCRAFWDAVVCWPHAVVGESVHRACPAVFSLFRNSTGSVSRNCTDGGWSRPYPPYHVACSVDDDIPEEATLCQELHPHPTLPHVHPESRSSVHQRRHFVLKRRDQPLHPLHRVPVLFIVLWIGSRVYFEDTECWDINEDSLYWWIIKGPIVVSIVHAQQASIPVNFMLFVNIVRILIQKLSPRLIQFNNSSQYRRLTKSTLLLIPLFGTHYMFFNFLPDYFNINLRLCIELCIGSFQGLLVAILYCFLNQEVQKEVHMQWLRWQERSYGVVSPAAKCSMMDTPF